MLYVIICCQIVLYCLVLYYVILFIIVCIYICNIDIYIYCNTLFDIIRCYYRSIDWFMINQLDDLTGWFMGKYGRSNAASPEVSYILQVPTWHSPGCYVFRMLLCACVYVSVFPYTYIYIHPYIHIYIHYIYTLYDTACSSFHSAAASTALRWVRRWPRYQPVPR